MARLVNRKSDLERHLWSLLERDNGFHRLVKPNNRIKMYLSKQGDPRKTGTLQPADLPQVTIKPVSSSGTAWDDEDQQTFGNHSVTAFDKMSIWAKRDYDFEIEVKGDGGLETILLSAGPKLGLAYVTGWDWPDVSSTDEDDNDGNHRVMRRVSTIKFTIETQELINRDET
jgi:hypothetical protein